MSREKEYYLVIDTETCNTIDQPIPYDIGYAICDRLGNIYEEKAFVVADVFCDMSDVMQSAYFADKIPSYWEDIATGRKVLKTFYHIHNEIIEDMKKYKVKTVMAYNMGFDKRALNNLIRYCTKSKMRWFFPFGTKFNCIWSMACSSILNTKTYIDFAKKNGLVSNANNILTSAESCYKFLTKNVNFEEVHKGLEDVRIEVEIFAKCIATHKKLDREINPSCWRIPQKKK